MCMTGNTLKIILITLPMRLAQRPYSVSCKSIYLLSLVVKELDSKGWGVDVVSGGEMATVQAVTGTLENSLFNGTYKQEEEIEFFMNHDGGHISVDNRYEIPMIEKVASKLEEKQPVIMRINLDVGAETHPMVLTTGYDQQFGISIAYAEEALQQIYEAPSLLFSEYMSILEAR